MPSGPKLAVTQRYHQMLCQMRGPHEWSRRPSAVGEVEPLVADRDRAGDRHVLLGVAAGELVRRARRRLLALVPLRLAALRPARRR